MPIAHCMSIIYRKGSMNESDALSRRLDFFHPDTDVHLRKPVGMFALWWDGKVPDLCYQSNETSLLVLSADTVSVDDGFLTKLETAYSSCSYFVHEKTRWKGHGLIKSSGGLYTYHDRLVILRPTQDMRILLLTEYHDNASHMHPNRRRLLAPLFKRFWRERMSFDCKNHCSNCVVCNRAKPNRQGSSSSSPLGGPNYPWDIVGLDFVTNLPKSSKNNFTAILILVSHFTKLAHFVLVIKR
jgi:hypothetical protein